LKFTAYEAEGIQGLIANSPLMSWMYSLMTVRGAGDADRLDRDRFGSADCDAPVCALHFGHRSIGAIIMFLITMSFVFTTPGVWQPNYGFPFPSPMPGQFLAKRPDAARGGHLDGGRSVTRGAAVTSPHSIRVRRARPNRCRALESPDDFAPDNLVPETMLPMWKVPALSILCRRRVNNISRRWAECYRPVRS
jgi:hypothetical protein